MNHASLFSGIGGFDLAAEAAGMQNIFSVENDAHCDKVLRKRFPNVRRFYDITEFDGREYAGAIDVLSGGFPCQPFSVAGNRKGSEDDRALWPEMLRVIREIRPTWVLGENVPGIINMELDSVLSDLEGEGYEIQAFVIPALSQDARHRRDRVWIVAHSADARVESLRKRKKCPDAVSNADGNRSCKSGEGIKTEFPNADGETGTIVPNADGNRLQGKWHKSNNARQAGLYNREAGRKAYQWPTEPCVGRVAHRVPNRVDRLKSLGNAIVPQIAFQLFRMIMEAGGE